MFPPESCLINVRGPGARTSKRSIISLALAMALRLERTGPERIVFARYDFSIRFSAIDRFGAMPVPIRSSGT